MKHIQTRTNFLSYLCILLAFFILLFFTKDFFSQIQIALDEQEQAKQELMNKEKELWELNKLQQLLRKNEEATQMEIKWLMWNFSDSDILEYMHSYAGTVNAWEERLIIRDIALSGDKQTDIWFRKAEISLSVIVSSEKTLFNFLNYLTSDSGKYKFYIANFSYPMTETTGNMQVSIPLSLYYK